MHQGCKRRLPTEDFIQSKRRSHGSSTDTYHDQKPNSSTLELVSPESDNTQGPFNEGIEDDDDSRILSMLQTVREGAVSSSISEPFPNIWLPPRMTDSQEQSMERYAQIRTATGESYPLRVKAAHPPVAYERLIAARSTVELGRAQKSFYGVEIHRLLDETAEQASTALRLEIRREDIPILPSTEAPISLNDKASSKTLLWTEKYRAKKFTDLVGDERTHRSVLRWLKGWDPIVFPNTHRPKSKQTLKAQIQEDDERPHRKILLLTGPPGLGKTTLAHVCAKQAGYEVMEINASDERNREVVKGRIKDSVGTENITRVGRRRVDGSVREVSRPLCVIVDEVDGVVSGGNGGEGGFIKALIDLLALDQKNTSIPGQGRHSGPASTKSGKGDRFRLLRPIILICNDVYHPALRFLRSSNVAEIIAIRKPPLDKVVARMKSVFDKEGIVTEGDGVRRLCEATWGLSQKGENRSNLSNTGEGDIRGVLVVAEWAAGRLRSGLPHTEKPIKLTREWVERHMIADLSHGGGGARGLGHGGIKEAVERVFLESAGFPKLISAIAPEDRKPSLTNSSAGVSEMSKRIAMERLREIIEISGDCDRIMTDCFTVYPSHPFQDDTFLSKPNAACEWLNFHDTLSSRIFAGQEWELNAYFSQSILGFHYLFASPLRHSWRNDRNHQADDEESEPQPFSGPKADFESFEAQKQNKAILLSLQSSFSGTLLRSFRSAEEMATDLVPHLVRIVTPNVKPIIAGGAGEQRSIASVRKEGERKMVERAVSAMYAVGVTFEKGRVESAQGAYGGHVYRMEPPLDTLSTFETASHAGSAPVPTRYAIRQVLDQEFQKYVTRQRADARQARYKAGMKLGDDNNILEASKEDLTTASGDQKKPKTRGAKRDFFGRIINEARPQLLNEPLTESAKKKDQLLVGNEEGNKVWISFHEGYSNAVRKPITLEDLMRDL